MIFDERWISNNHTDIGLTKVRVPKDRFFSTWPITLTHWDDKGAHMVAEWHGVKVYMLVDPLMCLVESFHYTDATGAFHEFIFDGMGYREVKHVLA